MPGAAAYLLYRLSSSTAFVPPNPKLLVITASHADLARRVRHVVEIAVRDRASCS